MGWVSSDEPAAGLASHRAAPRHTQELANRGGTAQGTRLRSGPPAARFPTSSVVFGRPPRSSHARSRSSRTAQRVSCTTGHHRVFLIESLVFLVASKSYAAFNRTVWATRGREATLRRRHPPHRRPEPSGSSRTGRTSLKARCTPRCSGGRHAVSIDNTPPRYIRMYGSRFTPATWRKATGWRANSCTRPGDRSCGGFKNLGCGCSMRTGQRPSPCWRPGLATETACSARLHTMLGPSSENGWRGRNLSRRSSVPELRSARVHTTKR